MQESGSPELCVKSCKKCGKSKPTSEFYKESRVKDGLTARCKDCMKSDASSSYWSDPEHHKARVRASYDYAERRKRTLREAYGITPEQYVELFEHQKGQCAVCGCSDSGHNMTNHLVVDHCHDTNEVRGLLCNNCNFLIGHAKNKINNLLAAADYLKAPPMSTLSSPDASGSAAAA